MKHGYLLATLSLGMGCSAARVGLSSIGVSAQEALPAAMEGQSHFVERDGQRIHVWEKAPRDWGERNAKDRRVVVFVHGATYSGRPDFDLGIRDYSVMEAFARAGWDTFAVDAQGYGASDDPKEGNWCRATDAALDLDAAVEWISAERGVEQVSIVGWSWGVQVAGEYAQEHADRVSKLVLEGGHYRSKFPISGLDERFRVNTAEGAASDFIEGCFEQDVVDLYVAECLKHDASTPNGSLLDFQEGSDQILEPEKLSMPVLMILGEHEASSESLLDLGSFFAELGASHKRFLVLPGGGHAILLEKPHLRWQREVLRFLGEDWGP